MMRINTACEISAKEAFDVVCLGAVVKHLGYLSFHVSIFSRRGEYGYFDGNFGHRAAKIWTGKVVSL